MVDWTERSFDLVGELAKQIITLSSGIIAVSVTFLTDVARGKSEAALWVLGSSWVAMLLALVFGVALLMTLAGLQRDGGRDGAERPTIDASNLTAIGKLMILTFVAGIILLLVAGVMLF